MRVESARGLIFKTLGLCLLVWIVCYPGAGRAFGQTGTTGRGLAAPAASAQNRPSFGASGQPLTAESLRRAVQRATALSDEGKHEQAIAAWEDLRTALLRQYGSGPMIFQVEAMMVSDYAQINPDRAIALGVRLVPHLEKERASQVILTGVLNQISHLYLARDDVAKARQYAERAVSTASALPSGVPESRGIQAQALSALGDVELTEHRATEAAAHLRRALELYEKLSPDSLPVVAGHHRLAEALLLLGRTGEAELHASKAYDLARNRYGLDHPQLRRKTSYLVLRTYATVQLYKGEAQEADRLLDEAAERCRRVEGSENSELATILAFSSLAKISLGDRKAALELLDRATRIARAQKNYGPGDPVNLVLLSSEAQLDLVDGRFGSADVALTRMLSILEGMGTAPSATKLGVLLSLALARSVSGDTTSSYSLVQKFQATLAGLPGGLSPALEAGAKVLLAEIALLAGRLPEALELSKQALALYSREGSADDLRVVAALDLQARILLTSGADAEAAVQLLERAIRIRQSRVGDDGRTAALWNRLAVVQARLGRTGAALDAQRRAAGIAARELRVSLAADTAARVAPVLAMYKDWARRIVTFHVMEAPSNKELMRSALDAVLSGKGRLPEEFVAGVVGSPDPMTEGVREAVGRLRAMRSRLAFEPTMGSQLLASLGPADSSTLTQIQAGVKEMAVQIQSLLRQAGSEASGANLTGLTYSALLEAVEEKLLAETQKRRPAGPSASISVTAGEVAKSMPPDAALIEFVRFEVPGWQTRGEQQARYAAYVLDGDARLAFADLGEAKSIEDAVAAFRKSISALAEEEVVREQGRAMFRLLVAPLWPALRDRAHLIFAPDGALNLLPFAALVDEGGRSLVEHYKISYVTSGRDLLRTVSAPANNRLVAVFADPKFDSGTSPVQKPQTDALLDFRSLDYTPLPGTGQEASQLRILYPDAAVYLTERATEAALKQVHTPRILHVATHGFFLDDDSAVAGRGRDLAVESLAAPFSTPALLQRPMLRSGLVLAGVKQQQSGLGEDGVLTALEAAALDLKGTSLVFLSACNTGVGSVHQGEAVSGFRTALRLAGAESQVVTLWRIDDRASAALVSSFYRRLRAGSKVADSLRQAQLELMGNARYRHPYFWAGFLAVGK